MRKHHVIIGGVAVIALVVALSMRGISPLLFSLCVGYLVSFIFWLMVVVLPENKRRRILRENLSRQYQHFRHDVVGILLNASGRLDRLDEAERLTDYKAFKEFFGANNNEMWVAALSELQLNDEYVNELLVQIQILSDEMSYVLNNISINDRAVFEFFKNLSVHVYKLKNSPTYTEDHVKHLSNFVWEILAQWSFITGQRQDDIVQKMISQI